MVLVAGEGAASWKKGKGLAILATVRERFVCVRKTLVLQILVP